MEPLSGEERWAGHGLAELTGPADGPPQSPPAVALAGILATERAHRSALHAALGGVGGAGATADRFDLFALLAERAAPRRFTRAGRISCGGAARLLPTATPGVWCVVSLPRRDDADLATAWLDAHGVQGDRDLWERLAGTLARTGAEGLEPLLATAHELGIAAHRVGGWRPEPAARVAAVDVPAVNVPAVSAAAHGSAGATAGLRGVRVLDCSALWAGPLCSRLLADAGAGVVRVEDPARPDPARHGDPQLFARLASGKATVALDLRGGAGRRALRELVDASDVVIESSRPRAFRQLGIDPEEVLQHSVRAGAGPRVWVSITAHGRGHTTEHLVGFGDDSAAAGGLVHHGAEGPSFLGDAIADPLTGVTAATLTLEALMRPAHVLLDVPLAGVAGAVATGAAYVPGPHP